MDDGGGEERRHGAPGSVPVQLPSRYSLSCVLTGGLRQTEPLSSQTLSSKDAQPLCVCVCVCVCVHM